MERRSTVKIIEMPNADNDARWLLAWSAMEHEQHGSVIEALRAIHARDHALAEAGIYCRTAIEWHAKTAAGRAVIRALERDLA